jgi:predicted RNA-binding Zn ribbon-like protein
MSEDAPQRWVTAPAATLCLDFANTRFWRGSEAATETLNRVEDLVEWCAANAALPRAQAAAWPRRAEAFAQALALREAIYRVFLRLADGATPDPGDVGLLNRAFAAAPPRRVLAARGAGFGWEIAAAAPDAVGLLTPVLWSAGDLLTGPSLVRLRHCANPRCLWLFVDDSRSGNRRWCSMAACGNRAKAHRHYVKRKAVR